MPEDITGFLWYALNAAFLIILWFARSDLKEIKDQLKRGHKNYHNLYSFMIRQNSRCNMLHPDAPTIDPPEWEE